MLLNLVATYYFPAGAATADQAQHLASSLPELAKALVRRGHRVRVVARKTPNTPASETAHGVEIRRVSVLDLPWLRLASWRRAAAAALRSLERDPADLTLCWDWSATLPALDAKPKGPVVCSLRNSSEAWRHLGSPLFPLYLRLERQAYSNCAHLIASSRWADETVSAVMHLDTPRTVLPHGIDTEKFSPRIPPAPLAFPRPVIGFFGRLDRAKAVDVLLDALAPITEPWSLVLIGDGAERRALERQAAALGISDRIHFLGFQPRASIPAHMAACDLICLPSRTEGFSSVVVEAIAMGKPLIATTVGGAPEALEHNSGILVPPEDATALRAALQSLLADPQRRASLGKAARLAAEHRYAWPVVVEQWEQLLERIAQVHKP